MKSTITLTFANRAENHVGMQIIGEKCEKGEGFDYDDLMYAKKKFEKKGCVCELLNLKRNAYVLVIRGGANVLSSADKLLAEQNTLTPDKKALMYGRVVNKKARYNLCYADFSQEADYENGKGTIIDFKDVPNLNKLREKLPKFFGQKAEKLVCEGNFYYDVNKCYIAWHGDSERDRVIAFRFGASIPLYFQWYHHNEKIGDEIKIKLNHGDVYVMSQKAVGTDWRCSSIKTIRHACGKRHLIKS